MKKVHMQDIGNVLEIRDQQLKTILYIYIQTAVSKPHGNCKPKIHNRYTHKKEKGIKTQH